MTDEIMLNDEQKAEVVNSEALALQYTSIVIANNDEYTEAGETLKKVAGAIKNLENMRLEKTRPLDKLKKDWTEWFARPIDKLKQADEAIRKARRIFFQDMEDKRRAEEAKARELAQKEADKLLKKAVKAEEKGQTDKAEALQEQAQQVASITPVIESKVEETAGISMRKNWKFEIIDENKIPRAYLTPDLKKIGAHVRALKEDCKIDGVKVFFELGENVRS